MIVFYGKAKKKPNKLYSNRIRYYLKAKGMTQNQLAIICETDKHNISKIVNGLKRQLSLAMAIKIANALGEPVEKVFFIR